MTQAMLELSSNLISLIILILIFVKYFKYKKKLDVLKGLGELKKQKKLTNEDKSFISKNLQEYQIILLKDEQRIKLVYPLFILIAGILLAFLEFKVAMIHLNVVVVIFIYMQIGKIHTKNLITALNNLNK